VSLRNVVRCIRRADDVARLAQYRTRPTGSDHQFTTVALARALTRWRRPVTLLLYTNHADQNQYPYGPAGTIVSLPPPRQDEVLLDGLYSHPVSPDVQRLKLFALEAMHDLRLSPSRPDQLVVGDDRATEPEKKDPMSGVNYFRRAPRSNELLFVYTEDSLTPCGRGRRHSSQR